MKKLNFHMAKRAPMPWYFNLLIRAVAIVSALLVSAVLITILTKKNPIDIYITMFKGAFGTNTLIWSLLQDIAILLCISLAVTPAFKMKFWNCGAEGQVLVGGLATVSVMLFLGGKIPYPLLIVTMIVVSVITGIVWAVIPAVFKALWNTNETLFTLMMNYMAIQLVAFFLKYFVKSGSGTLEAMPQYGLPVLFGNESLLNILTVAILTVLVYIYLKKTKQGYEISVVGESENTAKYIGINVPKVIVRTLVVSGALCGVAGLLLVGGTSHNITTETAGGNGFTAIMVSWLAKFNPFTMILTAFLIVFLRHGASEISTLYHIPEPISDIITGIILFFIIGCEFFINYQILITKNGKEND